jgi:hypothetical protein
MSTVWWFDNNRPKWELLQKEAHRQVETVIDAEHTFVLFHLAIKCHFTNSAGYTVYYRLHEDERLTHVPDARTPALRRIIWDKAHDIQCAQTVAPWLFTSEPTMATTEIELSARHFADMLERVKHIAIPLVGFEPAMGLDGCTYELSQQQFFGSYHLRWWAHGPATWRELTKWADDFISAVDVAIDGA